MPETRQHFFLFFPDFLFLPVVSSPAALHAKASEGAPFSRTCKSMSILFCKNVSGQPRIRQISRMFWSAALLRRFFSPTKRTKIAKDFRHVRALKNEKQRQAAALQKRAARAKISPLPRFAVSAPAYPCHPRNPRLPLIPGWP
jgi:hypothetical protein